MSRSAGDLRLDAELGSGTAVLVIAVPPFITSGRVGKNLVRMYNPNAVVAEGLKCTYRSVVAIATRWSWPDVVQRAMETRYLDRAVPSVR